MDSIRSASASGINLPSPSVVNNKSAAEEVPVEQKDSSVIGSNGEKPEETKPGVLHRMFRGAAKMTGATAGLPIGAVDGALESAVEGDVSKASPNTVKFFRGLGASLGFVAGASAGLVSGPAGLIVGMIAGPIIGSALGAGIPEAAKAVTTTTAGAAKGGWQGMKKGAEIGGKTVDWIVGKFSSPPKESTPNT